MKILKPSIGECLDSERMKKLDEIASILPPCIRGRFKQDIIDYLTEVSVMIDPRLVFDEVYETIKKMTGERLR